MGEINAMTNKDIQINRLKATRQWLGEQEKVLMGRKEQGIIRYKTNKMRGSSLQNSPEKHD